MDLLGDGFPHLFFSHVLEGIHLFRQALQAVTDFSTLETELCFNFSANLGLTLAHVDERFVAHDFFALVELALQLRGHLGLLSSFESGQPLFHLDFQFEGRFLFEKIKVGIVGQPFIAQLGVQFGHDGLASCGFSGLEFEIQPFGPVFLVGLVCRLKFVSQLRFPFIAVPRETVLNLGLASVTVGLVFDVLAMIQLGLDFVPEGAGNVIDGFGERHVVLGFQPLLPFCHPSCVLLVELLFDFLSQFIPALGEGQFHVLSQVVFKHLGFVPKLGFNLVLELLSDVFFEAQASTIKLDLQSSFSLPQALTQLLLKSASNAASQLVFPLSEHGLVPFLKTSDFFGFHALELLFHFLSELGFHRSQTMLKRLVVLKAYALLLDVQPSVVLFAKLSFDGGLDGRGSLKKLGPQLRLILFPEGAHSTVEAEVELLANFGLLMGEGVAFEFGQLVLHVGPKVALKGVKGHFVLDGQFLRHVGFHGVDAFGDGLLAQSPFPSQIRS